MQNKDKSAFALLLQKAFSLRGHAESKVDLVLLGAWWEQLRIYEIGDVNKAVISIAINEQIHLSVGRIIERLKMIIQSRSVQEKITAVHQGRAKELSAPAARPALHSCLPPAEPPPKASDIPNSQHSHPEHQQEQRIKNAQNYFLDMHRAMKHKGIGGPEMAQKFFGSMQGMDPGAHGEGGNSPRKRIGEIVFLEAAIEAAKKSGVSMLPTYIGPRPLWSYAPKDQAAIKKRWSEEFGGEGSFRPKINFSRLESMPQGAADSKQETCTHAHQHTAREPQGEF